MLTYTVYEPAVTAPDLDARAEELVFVKDGFSFAAFLLGPIWLAGQRLWLALAASLVALALVVGLYQLIPGGNGALGSVLLLAAYAFGLEAEGLQRWTLERRGYRLVGTVSGKTLPECEQRFLSGWLSEQRAPVAASAGGPASPASRPHAFSSASASTIVARA